MTVALVTGIGGFVGQYLANDLASNGRDVIGLTTDASDASSLPAQIKEADIRNEDAISKLIASVKPDEIYHLAAISRPAGEKIREYYETNVLGTLNIIQAAIPVDAKVLVVGSAYAYGSYDEIISENFQLRPVNPYGASKAAQDSLAGSFLDSDARIMRVRPFNHTGPGQDPAFLIPGVIQRLLEHKKSGKDVTIGNVSSVRDFLNVKDVVHAYRAIMTEVNSSEVFNVCSGVGYSVSDIYSICCEKLDLSVKFVEKPELLRRQDINYLVGSPNKLFAETSWNPKIEMSQTISEIIDSFL